VRTQLLLCGETGPRAPRCPLKLTEQAVPKGPDTHAVASPWGALGIHTSGPPYCEAEKSRNEHSHANDPQSINISASKEKATCPIRDTPCSLTIGAPLATVPARSAAKHRVMRHSSLLSLDCPGPDQAATRSAVRHATGDASAGGCPGVGLGGCTPAAPPRVHRVPRVRLHLGADRSVCSAPKGRGRE